MKDKVSLGLLSSLADFAVFVDGDGLISRISDSAQSFLELPWSPVGEPLRFFVQPEDMSAVQEAMDKTSLTGEKQSFICRLLKQRVLPVWADCHVFRPEGSNETVFAAFDASHWKEKESKLSHLSTHDSLTGLPSRILLGDRVKVGINIANREKKGLALLLLDLDGFKNINDSLGHETGDELIKAVAERLRGSIRRSDTVARLGGDEFALILVGPSEPKDIEIVSRKILASVQRPFQIFDNMLYISTSLGAAVYPEHGEEPVTLLKHAEMAMYNAKKNGKNRWKLFDKETDGAQKGDVSLDAAMHEGMKNGEFLLHYQPVFCMQTGVLKGAEALMRWDRPGQGMISPGKFIPLAESNGLIEILGAWALRMACHQAKIWQDAGFPDFYVSVNVSPRQFRQQGFADLMQRALSESNLPPSSLMLEITEGVLMQDPESSNAVLDHLRSLGVKIAIDDFGTGYSSLSYLKKFPLSVLKIDKSFVDDVPQCAEDVAIVSSVLNLADGLGLTVVAEGVEQESQHAFLKAQGCHLVQGYLTGKPMNVQMFTEKLMS